MAAKNHKLFFSLRPIQISTTSGHSAILEANVPTELHRELWAEAFKLGAMEFDPELIRAAARAIETIKVPAKPKATFKAALLDAVQAVLARKHPNELNKQGVPTSPAVRKEMTATGWVGDFKKLTTSAIYDTFLALQPDPSPANTEDETDLADEDGIDEPVGGGLKALLGESAEDAEDGE